MTHATLLQSLWPQPVAPLAAQASPAPGRGFAAALPAWARAVVLVLVGSALVAASAQVTLPFYPVPATLQPLVVLLIGMAYGSRLGAATMLTYLLEGAMGLPVFSQGRGGLPHLLGPTGGYLVGFVLAAWLVGRLAERGWDRRPLRTVAAMLLGNVAIYVPGLLVLLPFMNLDWTRTLAVGLTPFVLQDMVKVVVAAGLLPAAWQLVGRKAARQSP